MYKTINKYRSIEYSNGEIVVQTSSIFGWKTVDVVQNVSEVANAIASHKDANKRVTVTDIKYFT